jgi:hypothetical protein
MNEKKKKKTLKGQPLKKNKVGSLENKVNKKNGGTR